MNDHVPGKFQQHPDQRGTFMSILLHIKTSLFSNEGHSSRLSAEFSRIWLANHPGSSIVTRDLALDSPPHLDAAIVQAFSTPTEQHNQDQATSAAYSDRLIEELKSSDAVVIGLPLYNLGIPSTLKSYFDQIARAGITFRYTEYGPVGMLKDKPIYILCTRGGLYQGTDMDTQTPQVSQFFALLGLNDVHFIYAEGLNLGEEQQTKALSRAESEIRLLAA